MHCFANEIFSQDRPQCGAAIAPPGERRSARALQLDIAPLAVESPPAVLDRFANPIDAVPKESSKNDYVTMPRSGSPKGFISCASSPHPVEGVISDRTETQ
jgi:hypothetical protein